jgi:branched-subunit amino acid ABC-type transport system permease component
MEILLQLVINGLISGSLYALVALGFTILYSPSKVFNIAHGAMIPLGGYLTLTFTKFFSFPLYASIPAAVLLTGACGVILDMLIYARQRAKKSSGLILLITSLGAFTALQALISIVYSTHYQSIPRGYEDRLFSIWDATITGTQLAIILIGIFFLAAAHLFLKYTDLGKKMRAVSDDPEVATIIGIDTEKVIRIAFFIGSAIAGSAGILIGLDVGLEPQMGMFWFLGAVVGAIVGSIGSIGGGYVGSLIVGMAENFGIWKLAGEWRSAIAFGILILVLLFRPQGLFKRKQ